MWNYIGALENWTGSHMSRAAFPAKGTARGELFDDLALTAAGALPRRTLLKLGMSGFAATALGVFGLKPAWGDTCNCNGQTYDSDTQCCTPGGVQNRYPIANLGACPDRVPHPGYTAGFNGCGPEGSVVTYVIPGAFGLATFTGCCNDHDICYGTCLDNKANCDSTFLTCLNHQCNVAYQQIFHGLPYDDLYQDCLNVASVYYAAVHFGGGSAFTAAQDGACDCCGPANAQQPCCPQANVCGNQCCAPNQTCINQSCCPDQNICGTQCCSAGQSCVNGTCQSVCSYQCPCPSGPNAGKIFASCAGCLAACPSGLACFGYEYCVPIGSNCATCP